MKYFLETERLRLRSLVAADAQNLVDLNSDPAVMQYLSNEASTLEGMMEVMPRIIARNDRYHDRLGLFGAIEKSTDEFIGWFILRPDRNTPDDTSNLEVGYRLKQRFWNKGYGTEATRALIEKARELFGARRIYAAAMPGNRASIHIMEKCGLTLEKAFQETDEKAGTTIDLVLYSRHFD